MATYSSTSIRSDHFVPESSQDPAAQRRLRGQLEQIDYTAFASNREIIGHTLGVADAQMFQMMAISCASARAQWAKEALAISATGAAPTAEQVRRLSELRAAFDELSAAYEALRRMVERGYLNLRPDPSKAR